MRTLIPALAMLSLATIATPSQSAPVATESGRVQGVVSGDVLSFKGIPYAAPPVGPLRWRAPQPAAKWSGAYHADAYGHDCMQVPFPSDAAPLGTPPAEDCLYLNIWRPAAARAAGEKRPVLVWIYGGGFVNGGSSPAVYDGSAFAKQGIIFVSFNYRLGRFGFFAHPALTAANEGLLGNYGLLDQIAALAWVRRNIAAFGGDPDKVTLIGESAGGISVLDLMASPMARNLFQQAVIMSGGGRSLLPERPLQGGDAAHPSAEQVGLNFAQAAGIEGSGPDALDKLRALPAEAVRGDLNMATMQQAGPPTYAGGPILDGHILPTTSEAAFASGAVPAMPVMVGTTSADIGFGVASTKNALFATFGADATAARTAYDSTGNAPLEDVAGDVFRDRMMTEPARFIADRVAALGSPAWLYRFGYVATSVRKEWKGALHATDIPYFFNTVSAKYRSALTPEDAQAADLMNRYVAAFVRTGKPEGKGLPAWAPFNASGKSILLFTDTGAQSGADPLAARLDLQSRYQASKP